MCKLLSCLLSFMVIFYPISVSANEKISFGSYGIMNQQPEPPEVENAKIAPLKKGQRAPFGGTLFNSQAAAQMLVNIETQKEQCEIEKNKELDKQAAKHELELLNMKAAKDAANRRAKEIVDLKNEQIKFIQEQAIKNAKKEKNMPAIVAGSIGGGVLAGVLLTVAAAFIVREVR